MCFAFMSKLLRVLGEYTWQNNEIPDVIIEKNRSRDQYKQIELSTILAVGMTYAKIACTTPREPDLTTHFSPVAARSHPGEDRTFRIPRKSGQISSWLGFVQTIFLIPMMPESSPGESQGGKTPCE